MWAGEIISFGDAIKANTNVKEKLYKQMIQDFSSLNLKNKHA